MNKCEGCGARIDPKETNCPYCGSAYPQEVMQNNTKPHPVGDPSKILYQPAVDTNHKVNLVKRMIPGIIMFFFIPIIGVFMIISAIAKSKKA